MMERILLAVDDSPGGLAAARVAVGLAADQSARLRALHVLTDGAVDRGLRSLGRDHDVHGRRGMGGEALLRYVAELAERVGVTVECVEVSGDPGGCVLEEARQWVPDVVVIGRSDRVGLGEHYVGSEVRQVLEFAEQPVIVVPTP